MQDQREPLLPGLGDDDDDVSSTGASRGAAAPEGGYGGHVVFAFTVNMVMGAGVVGLPYAFFHAGAWVSCVCLTLSTIMAIMTMHYIVEVCGWCEGWVAQDELCAEDRCAINGDDEGSGGGGKRLAGPHIFAIGERSFQLTELCGVFLGVPVREGSWLRRFCDSRGRLPVVRKAVEVLLCANILISCWLYVSVFASSLSIIAPAPFVAGSPADVSKCMQQCHELSEAPCVASECLWVNATCTKGPELRAYCASSYRVFAWGFGVVMSGVLCMDVSGLSSMQGSMTLFAFLSLTVMVVTCLIAIKDDTGDIQGWDAIPQTDLSGLGQIVTAAVTSQISHQGVPSLVVLMRNKRSSRRVFGGALCYTLVMYVLLCMSTSVFFGPDIANIVTLNWEEYSGGARPGDAVPWWAGALSYMVLLFPVVSVSAAFPLQIVVVSEIILKAFGLQAADPSRAIWRQAPVRIVCCFVAVCLAQVCDKVQAIIEFNGLVCILIAFVLPCVLHLNARRASVSRWGRNGARTPYHAFYSHRWCVWGMMVLSLALEAFAVWQVLSSLLVGGGAGASVSLHAVAGAAR